MAVAVYDYEALAEPGEEDNLEFAEGDLIEVSRGGGGGREEGGSGLAWEVVMVVMVGVGVVVVVGKRVAVVWHGRW